MKTHSLEERGGKWGSVSGAAVPPGCPQAESLERRLGQGVRRGGPLLLPPGQTDSAWPRVLGTLLSLGENKALSKQRARRLQWHLLQFWTGFDVPT